MSCLISKNLSPEAYTKQKRTRSHLSGNRRALHCYHQGNTVLHPAGSVENNIKLQVPVKYSPAVGQVYLLIPAQ